MNTNIEGARDMTVDAIRQLAAARSIKKGFAVTLTKEGQTETLYMASAQSRDDLIRRARARGYSVSIVKP
jgi:hypothetical protein